MGFNMKQGAFLWTQQFGVYHILLKSLFNPAWTSALQECCMHLRENYSHRIDFFPVGGTAKSEEGKVW